MSAQPPFQRPALQRQNAIRNEPFQLPVLKPTTPTLKIVEQGLDHGDIEEVAWGIIECIAEAVSDGKSDMIKALITILVKGAHTISTEASVAYDLNELLEEGLIPNPYLIMMGYVPELSPKTNSYLTARNFKKIGGSVWCWGGAVASVSTGGVDVGTASLGAQSLALTGKHAYEFTKLMSLYPNEEFQQYIQLCFKAKGVKATSRGLDTAMAVIPGVALAGKIAVTAVNAVIKIGCKVTLGKTIDRASQMIHMHARQEQDESEHEGRPATELMKEIFKRRGILGGFGYFNQYDVTAIINESAGWMALSDKLKLI